MTQTRAGRSLHCAQCRSPIPVEAISATIHCPFCGVTQTLSQEILDGLRNYERAVDQKMQAADQHYLHANAWQQWSRMDDRQSPGKRLLSLYVWVIGLPVALSLIAMALHQNGLLKIRGPELSMGLMVVSLISIAIVVSKSMGARRGAQQRASVDSTTVACPHCGAKGALTPGQSVDSCQYCQSALAPTNTVMAMRLDAVQVELRRAAMAGYREERLGMAKLMGFSVAAWVPYMAMGPMFVGWGFTMIYMSAMMLKGSEPFHPLIVAGWALYGAIIAGFVAFRSLRAGKREGWQAVARDLARQFHGQLYPQVLDWVAWLNRYWPASYDNSWVAQGSLAASVGLEVGGFPTLVILDPKGHDAQRAAKIHVLVSAWIPGPSDGIQERATLNQEARQARQALLEAGFAVHILAAGILAEASQGTIKTLRRHPSAAHALSTIVTCVGTIALGAGGTPSPPTP